MRVAVLDFLKKPTSKNIIINTIGSYLNVFFTAFFVFVLTRLFDRAEYGVLSVLLTIVYLLATVLDFGTTATIYSIVPTLYEKKSPQLYQFIKSTFFYQSLFSLIVILVLFVSFPYVDRNFLNTQAPEGELYITSISILLLIWQNFFLNILFAIKKFIQANIYVNIANVFKTIILFILVWLHQVTVGSIIITFGIVGPIIFFILLLVQKRHHLPHLHKAKIKKEEMRFRYTLTYLLGSQCYNLGSRMDLILLSHFKFKNEVGDYAIAQKIILTILTTIISITQVLSPEFSKIKTKKDVIPHLKTATIYLSIPLLLFVVLYILPNWVFYIFFPTKYLETIPATRALSLPFAIYAIANLPYLFILYTIKKPFYFLLANAIFLAIVTVGCFYLIPTRGVFGPPVVFLVAFIISTIMLFIASIYEYKKLPDTALA